MGSGFSQIQMLTENVFPGLTVNARQFSTIVGATHKSASLAWIIHDFGGEKRKGALKD
jgi:hypothetical protein